MKEKDIFINSFRNTFDQPDVRGKGIILYGTGYITKWIVDNWPLNNNKLCGVMDYNYSETEFEGYRVIKCGTDTSLTDADLLVVMNRNPVITEMIYNRISDDLPEGIQAVDIQGSPLKKTNTQTNALVADEGCTYEEAFRHIDDSKIVSFDVFDTLVTRKVPTPEDLVSLLSYRIKKMYRISNFAQKRREAENIAAARTGYPTISEIYTIMCNEILEIDKQKAERLAAQLCSEELKAEGILLYKRKDCEKLLQHAIDEKKDVYIVSDTYYNIKTMRSLLQNAGIDCIEMIPDNRFYLSCERKASKDDGTLWNLFKDEVGDRKSIHFGDNPIADIKNCSNAGLAACCLSNPNRMWKLWDIQNRKDPSSLIQQGLLQAFFFNSPFGSMDIETMRDYGYFIIGPIVFNYLLWIAKETNDSSAEDKSIYFFARDGFFLVRLWERLSQALNNPIKGKYLYLSRAFLEYLCYPPKELAEKIHFAGKLSELLKYRFNIHCLKPGEKDLYVTPGDDITKMIDNYMDDIHVRREKSQKNYTSYLNQIGFYDQKEPVTVVDPSYKGTGQYLLSMYTKRRTEGFYCYADLSKDNIFAQINSMRALYQDSDDHSAERSFLYQYHAAFESSIMVSPEGSVLDIGDDGFVFTPEGETQLRFCNKEETYEGVKGFFDDVLNEASAFCVEIELKPNTDIPITLYKGAIADRIKVSKQIKDTLYTDDYYDKVYDNRSASW